MATTLVHRGIRIVTLAESDRILDHCRSDDIAIVVKPEGWWIYFVGDDGDVEGYDAPFDSYDKAMWTAKAAAEFAAE